MEMDVTYRGTPDELLKLLRDEAAALRAKPRPTRLDEHQAKGLDRAAYIVEHWVPVLPGGTALAESAMAGAVAGAMADTEPKPGGKRA